MIEGAIGTVTGTLIEAIVTATVCVLLVLLHVRTSLDHRHHASAGGAGFVCDDGVACGALGIVDIQTNIMSLAGIAISIGVLVDSSIVMAENAMHRLRSTSATEPVRGDVRDIVLPACQTVGRPIFFSVVIMLLSFLPVFALGGIEGKMFRPLAFTKSFALVAVALLAITLVPALCTIFIKGGCGGAESRCPQRDRGLSAGPVVPAGPAGAAGLGAGGDVPGRPRAARQPAAVSDDPVLAFVLVGVAWPRVRSRPWSPRQPGRSSPWSPTSDDAARRASS